MGMVNHESIVIGGNKILYLAGHGDGLGRVEVDVVVIEDLTTSISEQQAQQRDSKKQFFHINADFARFGQIFFEKRYEDGWGAPAPTTYFPFLTVKGAFPQKNFGLQRI
jgi:hypothetical protein